MLEPFSQHQLFSVFSSHRTTRPSKVLGPHAVPVNTVRLPQAVPNSLYIRLWSGSSFFNCWTPNCPTVGFSALLFLVTGLKFRAASVFLIDSVVLQ